MRSLFCARLPSYLGHGRYNEGDTFRVGSFTQVAKHSVQLREVLGFVTPDMQRHAGRLLKQLGETAEHHAGSLSVLLATIIRRNKATLQEWHSGGSTRIALLDALAECPNLTAFDSDWA